MADNPRFGKAAGAASVDVDGDVVVVSPTDRRCFSLNGTAGSVWGLLTQAGREGLTATELVDSLVAVYAVDRDRCDAEVGRLLAAMVDAGVATVHG